jgi:hypothetical protein
VIEEAVGGLGDDGLAALFFLGGAVDPKTVCVPGMRLSALLAISTTGLVPPAGASAKSR